MWYRTMTAILLRRERGRNNVEMYAVLVVTPPPLFSAKLRFKRGGVTTREYGMYKILQMEGRGVEGRELIQVCTCLNLFICPSLSLSLLILLLLLSGRELH